MDVKSASAELAANFQTQGWANDGKDMANAQSAILKRKRGNASITIFVKSEKEGTLVKMFTKGLSWDGK